MLQRLFPQPARIGKFFDAEKTPKDVDTNQPYDYQRESIQVQWCMFWATFAAFGAAAWYSFIAGQQKDSMDDTLRVSIQQARAGIISAQAAKDAARIADSGLEISQRAYLSAGQMKTPLGGFGLLQIPIINSGHTTSSWLKLSLDYKRTQRPEPKSPLPNVQNFVLMTPPNKQVILGRVLIKREDRTVIPPGQTGYDITVKLPMLDISDNIAINTGKEFIDIYGTIEYDTGFKKSDTIHFCATYQNTKTEWQNCGYGGINLELSESHAKNAK